MDIRINFVDNWEKKDIDLKELEIALETGNSTRYNNSKLNKIASKWKKYKERGVSNLYLIKEADDDGVACVYYAYSIKDGIIQEDVLERLRDICSQKLSVGEMRVHGSDCKPSEWWDTNAKYLMKLVESGKAEDVYEYLNGELFPSGIILDARSIKTKKAGSLACSAIAWGVSNSLFKKGTYMGVLIHNDLL